MLTLVFALGATGAFTVAKTVHSAVRDPCGRRALPELIRVIAFVFAKFAVESARNCASHVAHSTGPFVASETATCAPFCF